MDEQLKEKLFRYLDVLEEGARKGGDFIADKAPETVQQWVAFSLCSSAAWAISCFGTAIAAAVIVRFVWTQCPNWYPKDYCHDMNVNFSRVLCSTLGGIAVIAFGIAGMKLAEQSLLCWLAPNVFIIKELSSLVK